MKVLVCGGRDLHDRDLVSRTLDLIHQITPISCLIQGGARGADQLAAEWGVGAGVLVRTFEAEWRKHGRAAGPIRNQRMIDEAHPSLVVAFPGGRGTADMVARADRAGIRVVTVTP